MSSRKYLALMLTALLLPVTSQASPPRHTVPRYTVTVLPFDFSPTDINNAGQIAGSTVITPGVRQHAVLLSKGKLKDLGTLGGNISAALALNEAGDVTGFSLTSAGTSHAFLYTKGRMKDIGAPGPGDSGGLGLNDKRQVVGQFVNRQNLFRAALFSHHRVQDLGSLGGPVSAAFDINNAGTIVGESLITSEPDSPFHPFVIKKGVMTDIGTLAGGTVNSAQQINNCGQIAGFSEVGGALHVFLYDKGVMTGLGFFGGRQLTVEDMNEQGMIVGTADTPAAPVGYLYANGQLRDLDELVNPAEWDIQSAHGINDFGQIVATGCRDNVCSVLRLDPIKPIPKPRHCTRHDSDRD